MRLHEIIPENLLKQAVEELVEAIEASLPSHDECQHEFSAAFEEKMQVLIKSMEES